MYPTKCCLFINSFLNYLFILFLLFVQINVQRCFIVCIYYGLYLLYKTIISEVPIPTYYEQFIRQYFYGVVCHLTKVT